MITFAKNNIFKSNKSTQTQKITPQQKNEADAKYEELRIGIRNFVWKTFDGRDYNFVEEIEQSVLVRTTRLR